MKLNDADALYLGTATVSAAYLGTELVWPPVTAPVNIALPVITGATTPNSLQTCSQGTWLGSGNTYAYQWQLFSGGSWGDISGATSNTYTPTADGDYRCRVRATNVYDSTDAFTATRTIASVVQVQIGDQGSGGAGNWPTSANRALMRKITLTKETTLQQFNMRIRAGVTATGDVFKGLVYAADNTGGYPGTRLAVSAPTSPNSGGAEVLTAAFANEVIPAGEVWIGYVCNGGSGSGTETDSGGTSTNVAIMLNGGEVNYASPPATAGLWPGSPGPYSNVPSVWLTALQAP